MDNNNRPDLSARSIVMLTGSVIVIASVTLLWPDAPAPGSPLAQLCGALGALLLFAPFAFVIMKRSGLANSPPAWFIGHVLATSVGTCLIFIHVAAGDWFSPPGIILLLLVFLILQGSILRAIFSRGFSLLFARSSAPGGFNAPATLDKVALQGIIDAKTQLLGNLDPAAEEALFSPALKHWLRHPWNSFRYLLLAEREARMIGARASAGIELGWSRRIHMLAALGFYLGLVSHIVVVLFFAGYAAEGGAIDWWHITDWGG
ncbi:MAG: hypothetical protein OER98_06875 [Gammaproteobacteria bacterium]|nr:hypothetical protein [Gammaproteobacteria bacterium]